MKLREWTDGDLERIAQMERAAGVANGIVDDWKTSNPRIDSLRKVANALGVRVGDLLGE